MMSNGCSKHWAFLLVLFLALFPVGATGSEPMRPGNQLAPFSLEDQHGQEHELGSSISLILFTRNRAGAAVMTEFMEGREFLSDRGIAYINDISAMPSFAASLFALPKMRRRPYDILLDRNTEATARFPDKAGSATLIFLKELVVRNVEYVSDAEALGKRLEAMPKKR